MSSDVRTEGGKTIRRRIIPERVVELPPVSSEGKKEKKGKKGKKGKKNANRT